jgi:molybdenum cofactor synthesis domain-containing protein
MLKTAVLTISDTRMPENDASGQAIRELLPSDQFVVIHYTVVPDDKEQIKTEIVHCADDMQAELVLTTGGTGLGPRDVTPEATAEIIEKSVPGMAEWIRMQGAQKNKRAILSRGICGVRKSALIINLPGSPKGARESLECVLDVVPHALEMMRGKGH